MSFFEKVESVTPINNKSYDVYDRAITFQAQDFHN